MDVFIDSSVFVALNNTTDSTHEEAVRLNASLFRDTHHLLTSNFIIAESLTMIAQKVSLQRAIRFKEEDFQNIEVIRITEALEDQAFEIFKTSTSKNISYIDCTSFALMREMGVKTAFTFDTHFRKQGFKLLQ